MPEKFTGATPYAGDTMSAHLLSGPISLFWSSDFPRLQSYGLKNMIYILLQRMRSYNCDQIRYFFLTLSIWP